MTNAMDKPPSGRICAQNPQSSSPSRKVGIITTHPDQDKVYDEVKIYLLNVDLDSCGIDEYTRVLPAVRFRFPYTHGLVSLCLLNSTVYIFGGYYYDSQAKSAHKFELSSAVLAQPNYAAEIGGDSLAQISPMKYPKICHVSLPTPDSSKIIVFSRSIRRNDCNRAFEIYDPSGDFWEQIPAFPCRSCDSQGELLHGLPCICTGDEIAKVRSYSFVDESHFVVVTELGVFALDLEKENRAWVDLRIQKPPSIDRGYFVTVKGRYVLHSGQAFDYGDGAFFDAGGFERNGNRYSRGCRAPLSELPPFNEDWGPHDNLCCIARLHRPVAEEEEEEEEDNEVCHTCILQAEKIHGTDEACFLIDVCRTELTTLTTSVTNCVRLCVGILNCYFGVRMVSI